MKTPKALFSAATRNAPRTTPVLCPVNFNTPAFHDGVRILVARSRASRLVPEWNGKGEVVAWNTGECANRFAIRHRNHPTSRTGIGRVFLTEAVIITRQATILPPARSPVSYG